MTTWRVAPVLRASNVERALAYYTDVLGFSCPNGLIQGADADEGGIYALIERGGAGRAQVARTRAGLQVAARAAVPFRPESPEVSGGPGS